MFGSKIKKSELNSGDWSHQVVRIEINDAKIKQKMNMVGINEETLKILKEQKPLFEQYAEEIVGKFYEKISTIPHLMNIINNHSTIERLKMTQKEYFISLTNGVLDEQYITNRRRVGRVHDKIKLEPEWFFGAYQLYYKSIFPLLTKKYENDPRLPEVLLAFTRLTNFDMQLVEETYLEAYTSKMLKFDDIKKLEGKLLLSSEMMVANAEETSSSVQNMYASSQEITAATEEAAVYAEQVQKMGYRSKDAIENTITHIKEIEALMEKLQDSMVHIADSSKRIGEIISLIQGIAKQTNILSLNASIEAARAGEHGKGFSIVANEVKGLAQRTHEALEDISNLIQQSQGAVSTMMEAVNKTNLSVHEGSKYTGTLQKELNQMMDGITNNLEQVTTVTKQIKGFAEMSEQISNSSQEIAEMAEKLHSIGEELSDKLK